MTDMSALAKRMEDFVTHQVALQQEALGTTESPRTSEGKCTLCGQMKDKDKDTVIVVSAAPMIVLNPMPIPGTPNAPLFSGTNIKDFLDILESLAEAAQIPVSKLPKYVLRYCHNSVKDVIMNCELLDGDDWARVRDLMMELYASNDKPRLISANRFRKWIQNHAETASFDSETDIDEYYQNFVMKSGGLVKQELLGKKEQSILFFKGIPNPTRRRIYKRLPLDHSSTTSPPSITEVLELLRREFSEDRLDYEDDDCDDMAANEDDEGNEAEEISATGEANH